MERRKFIKKSGQALLAVSTISITGAIISSCSSDDSDSFFGDGYYGDGYYGDGYDDDGYYDDGYYDDGYYDDGYYDDGYYDDGYYDDGYYDDGYYGLYKDLAKGTKIPIVLNPYNKEEQSQKVLFQYGANGVRTRREFIREVSF